MYSEWNHGMDRWLHPCRNLSIIALKADRYRKRIDFFGITATWRQMKGQDPGFFRERYVHPSDRMPGHLFVLQQN